MPSVPDQPSPHHHPPQPSLAELRRRFGQWEIIENSLLPSWTAEHRSADGRHIRVLVAHTASDLAAKLDMAETVEP